MFNFARLKNWLQYENITSQDLNAEFNNIVQKAGADTLSSANSTNGTAPTVAAMQTQLNPGGLGTEVLALTTQQDIQQLRYEIAAITGNPYWYQAPAESIASIAAALQSLFTLPPSRIISGRVDANGEPMFLTPGGVTDSVTLKATTTPFVAFINGVQVTFAADITLSGITVAPAINNTALVNDASLVGQQSSAIQGEYGTYITIDTIGANITALNGKYAAFRVGTEYFVAEVDITNNVLKNCIRGAGFNQTDVWQARTVISNNDTITLMNLAWVFATFNASVDGLDIVYNKPNFAVVQPLSPAIGDYWYDVLNTTWKKYNGVSFVAVQAVLIGYCIVDTVNVVSARSFDFFKSYNDLNTIELEFLSTTQVRATRLDQEVSVYGVTYPFQVTQPIWNVTTTLDTGVVLVANFTYYTYVTNTGDLKTSDVAPRESKYYLLGQYHPAKPWRCIGTFSTDAGSLITAVSVSIGPQGITRPLLSPVGQKLTSSSGAFTTSSAVFVPVPNLSTTILTSGRPVMISIQPDGDPLNWGVIANPGGGRCEFAFFRDSTQLFITNLSTSGGVVVETPAFYTFMDAPPAGFHTYEVQLKSISATAVKMNYVRLSVYEL